MLYWLLKNFVLGPLILTLFRPWVIGRENVPRSGPVIFASNHVSFIDSVILPAVLDRRMSFLAKSDYFTGRGLKGWATKTFFNAIGQLPIDRSGGKASEASLRTGLQVLARGEQLGIYPEGTRSPDGKLYRGRTGIARMVLEGRVVVVPVAMVGTREVQQIGQKFPKFKRVGVVFGKPLDFSRFEGLETDRFILRSVTDEIMHELRGLSRQEYEDVYATSVKERATTARETVMRERRVTPGR
ncbi:MULTISPECIES: 1-acyl-sn-glycerol-3-phosphate acyltransferase [unclassified Curtobacterium]|jgi:1-acyl-sn-glycerol-3-phosphate acyltransferase|uniref:lysophospholipid acyltransferase family protein n=1 Tax=unclassified Curtobacterium TaxID=257496 RepID=UPI000D83AF67|nr:MULTISPECIES: lysophospholipid acyltransferase family protein [unclassified Curtobacterium]PYY43139.1 1-acyl-sn-glycerol-3-phosphate acyltransferase [Curtobacterium sp. MCPF17_046]PYY50730.1 1-acyl-sn-glycerol-3-phosphate acyltransferase [Curtobacterium sp. MCBD17_023]PZE68958.1 1-acyl-sn-glycerol-3-phosphate acyltransferase [Curtobacterium sp. MCBD17_021]PZE92598.1 1-acyl-sn-glycerol-3-phosphate acyltransferase [Curtobacterium sp. MCBD17_008]WIB16736.1 lysophospholipid acyltransferase fami